MPQNPPVALLNNPQLLHDDSCQFPIKLPPLEELPSNRPQRFINPNSASSFTDAAMLQSCVLFLRWEQIWLYIITELFWGYFQGATSIQLSKPTKIGWRLPSHWAKNHDSKTMCSSEALKPLEHLQTSLVRDVRLALGEFQFLKSLFYWNPSAESVCLLSIRNPF